MKKILISLFTIFTFLIIPNISANAKDDFNYSTLPDELDLEKSTYVVYTDISGIYTLIFTDSLSSPSTITGTGQNTFAIRYVSQGGNSFNSTYKIYQYNNSKWVSKGTSNKSITFEKSSDIKYSSRSFSYQPFYSIEKKNLVPPQGLVQMVQLVKMEGALEIVLTLVGLVVSLIVSLVAFRKSWTWLLSLLKFS